MGKLVVIFSAGPVSAGLSGPLKSDDPGCIGDEPEITQLEHHVEPHRAIVCVVRLLTAELKAVCADLGFRDVDPTLELSDLSFGLADA